jgi:hypothetical protein
MVDILLVTTVFLWVACCRAATPASPGDQSLNPSTGPEWQAYFVIDQQAGGVVGRAPLAPLSLASATNTYSTTFQSPAATCTMLEDALTQMFKVDVVRIAAPFDDYDFGRSGIDCQLTVVRHSTDPEDFLTIADDLKAVLMELGWQEDLTYIAYGPSETSLAFRKNDQSGLLGVGWQPSAELSCLKGQPDTGQRAYELRLYTISFSFTVAPLMSDDRSEPIAMSK